MSEVKNLWKWIIRLIIFYIFSSLLIFIGLNATYKNIESKEKLPSEVSITIAQATSVNGRIYGEVTSTEENHLNGKYIKVDIYTKKNNFMGTKFLKIENTRKNEPKKFAVNFKAENIGYYDIEIVDDSEELQAQLGKIEDLYKDKFSEGELALFAIILLAFGF